VGILSNTVRDVMMLGVLKVVSALTFASRQFVVDELYCTKARTCSAILTRTRPE